MFAESDSPMGSNWGGWFGGGGIPERWGSGGGMVCFTPGSWTRKKRGVWKI